MRVNEGFDDEALIQFLPLGFSFLPNPHGISSPMHIEPG
jgi:hypothetical protein